MGHLEPDCDIAWERALAPADDGLGDPAPAAACDLSGREVEVLAWIARGKSDWEIGRILAISAKTVNFHAERLKRKLAVPTRVQAVVRGLQFGLIR